MESKEYLKNQEETKKFKDIDGEVVYQLIDRALRGVFGEGEDAKKFVAANRIPFICNDIRTIRRDMQQKNLDDKEIHSEIKENQKDLNKKFDNIIYGLLATIGLYIIGKFLKFF